MGLAKRVDTGAFVLSFRVKITIWTTAVVAALAVFGYFVPSLLGLLICLLLFISVANVLAQRKRYKKRVVNNAVRAVCRREGGLSQLATAFARTGPLRGECYEFARRLMQGQQPLQAAARSRIPLQLGTAVALSSPQQLPADNVVSLESELHQDDTLPPDSQLMYLMFASVVTLAMLTFTNIFIVPTILQLMDEFGLRIPQQWLLVGFTPTWFLTVLGAILVLSVSVLVLAGRVLGWQPRWVPLMPAAAESRSQILYGVADALEQGLSFEEAFKLGNDISLHRREGKAYFLASRHVRAGVDPVQAMRNVGWVSRSEQEWLTDAPPPRTAQLLRHFGDRRVADANANMKWLMSVLFPAIVVILGVGIFLYAFGFMTALGSLVIGVSKP